MLIAAGDRSSVVIDQRRDDAANSEKPAACPQIAAVPVAWRPRKLWASSGHQPLSRIQVFV
jgi:hypothetical protein